ncbi:MAG: multicopper oxidase family protein [Pseudomonadota bacterium]
MIDIPKLSRRDLVKQTSCLAVTAASAGCLPKPATQRLVAEKADVWLGVDRRHGKIPGIVFNGQFPGPTLTLRQHQTTPVEVVNILDEPLSIHWHGLRVVNDQDGVGGLTQPSIQPGGTHTYHLNSPDAGTFWYHPHVNSFLQIAQGLFGPLLVTGENEPAFASDHVFVHSEAYVRKTDRQFALKQLYDISNSHFDDRLSFLELINGALEEHVMLPKGGWNRVRLIAGGPMSGTVVRTENLAAFLIALDGQPIPPTSAEEPITLTAGQRIDLAIAAKPNTSAGAIRFALPFNEGNKTAIHVTFEDGAEAPDTPPHLPENPHLTPVLEGAARERITMSAANPKLIDTFTALGAALGDAFKVPKQFWALNDQAMPEQYQEILCQQLKPLFTLKRGQTCVLDIVNTTDEGHPFHLHGHSFTCLSPRDAIAGKAPVRDTVNVPPGETTKVAFVADNPGDWMVHCHHVGHQAQGMMGWFAVT